MSASKRKSTLTRAESAKKAYAKPSELDLTEPPTSREIIGYYYHLKNSHPDSSVTWIDRKIVESLTDIWGKVNPNLPLMSTEIIQRKVARLRSKIEATNRKHIQKKSREDLEKKLDKLFDISSCECSLPVVPCNHKTIKCTIQNCDEVHIECLCQQKVPREEREYLRDQRNKTGPKGTFQLGSVDREAARRDRRREEENQRQTTTLASDAFEFPADTSVSSSASSCLVVDEDYEQVNERYHSTLKTPRFACELVRHGVSLRGGAAIFNALLQDINSFNMIRLPNTLKIEQFFMDKNKVKRQIDAVAVKASAGDHEKAGLTCIGVDGRTDNKTCILKEQMIDGVAKLKQERGKEHHLTFTCESGPQQGSYLTHRTLPLVGATGARIAQEVHTVLDGQDSSKTLKAVLCDNTAVNTGKNIIDVF